MGSVKTNYNGRVFSIVLNRPEKHNAFDPEMIKELTDAFKAADKSEARVVHLQGEGKSFCAGADLGWMKSMVSYSLEENIADSKELFEMFEAGLNCRLPIVGEFHGNVMGGALGLAAICDIGLAEESTKFCFSEVKLGLAPAVISPFVLKKVSPNWAREWMLTGKLFLAPEAQTAGLLNHVGDAQHVAMTRDKIIQRFCQAGPEAVKETKKLLKFVTENNWSDVKDMTTRVISERRVSDEGQEGLAAFFEKSVPKWKIEVDQ